MTKKEIHRLALRSAQETLRDYFGPGSGFADEYFLKGKGKTAVKKVYDILEPHLLDTPPKSAQ